ncbi:hypothetical protein BS50DRAFT_73901 [Corynespora cassiicola Philippines]|uniref:Uncharacterized protein n=1 Tax=Corynespora cassiicola Philippines TaxID=1448308 RepID=A0A2T2NG77_CORCC|nr:hypothetical protein BS50DRAFT_73901 [Corynespora cassiicola Philippines]
MSAGVGRGQRAEGRGQRAERHCGTREGHAASDAMGWLYSRPLSARPPILLSDPSARPASCPFVPLPCSPAVLPSCPRPVSAPSPVPRPHSHARFSHCHPPRRVRLFDDVEHPTLGGRARHGRCLPHPLPWLSQSPCRPSIQPKHASARVTALAAFHSACFSGLLFAHPRNLNPTSPSPLSTSSCSRLRGPVSPPSASLPDPRLMSYHPHVRFPLASVATNRRPLRRIHQGG